ncbi:MAG: hypothetical protein ACM3JD_13505 [Rudaea sp.]
MDFVFFSNTGWQTMDGAHRPAQLAKELLRRGHRVLFVELEDSPVKPNTDQLRVVGHYALGIGEREMTRAWYGRQYGDLKDWRAGVARALDDFERPDSDGRAVIWTIPLAPLVELAPLLKGRGYYLIYDCLDDFEGLDSAGYHLYFPEVEDYLVHQSDLLVVLSTSLYEKFRDKTDRIALVRDGIILNDFKDVTPRRTDPAALRLGFWGTITDFMIDCALLESVAAARPNWQIDLIGPYDVDPLATPVGPRLKAHPNIHLLGRQPHSALARHLSNFDACLIPSPVDRFNLGRDPVKTYEYLAGYRPVVATNLEQLAWMPYVYLARNPSEFIARIEEAAAVEIDRAVIDQFLAEQTWACRVDTLLEAVANYPPRASVLPFVQLPPKKSLAAAQAYIEHLEHELAERTALIHKMQGLLAEAGVRPALRRGWKRIRGSMSRARESKN